MTAPILELARIGKAFGATHALVDANLSLYPGQVTALLGENGAGKSTLVKILAGLHQPDTGEIRLGGQPARIGSITEARKLGISIVHQECVLFDNLSVAENILIADRPAHRGLISWPTLRRRAAALLRQLEAPFDIDCLVGELSIAQKHLVQIARGLSSDARIVILDEPTAALSHHEAQDLHRIVQQLQARGCAILLISHRFEEIFAIADRYVVFRDGRTTGQGLLSEVDAEHLIRLMVGRPVEQIFPPAVTTEVSEEALRVEHLSRAREFHDVSLSVRRGEILGVYGLVGAGRSELLQCLFGLTRADAGRIVMDGREAASRTPDEAIRSGLALLPEDRQHEGAILEFSIAANIALANLSQVSSGGFQVAARIEQLARHWMAALQIKAAAPDQRVADLSGGNQQKVVLAKWLATRPRVLMLDEPTKGVDVGSKAEVHRIMRELTAQGLAIIMASSDLPEVLGMSDRLLVMRRGRVRAQFSRPEASAERLAQAATGT